MNEKIICKVPYPTDDRHKNWAKLVTAVDVTKTNGYAFEGPWLKRGQLAELPVGGVVLLYDEVGSRKNHEPWVTIHVVGPSGFKLDADYKLVSTQSARGLDWALKLRDTAAKLLELREAVVELLKQPAPEAVVQQPVEDRGDLHRQASTEASLAFDEGFVIARKQPDGTPKLRHVVDGVVYGNREDAEKRCREVEAALRDGFTVFKALITILPEGAEHETPEE